MHEPEPWPPEGAEQVLEFVVLGPPKPAGSKSSGVATRWDPVAQKRVPVKKDGRFVTFTKDSAGAAGKSWRGDVRDAVAEVFGSDRELLDAPLVLDVRFYIERTATHFGTGKNAGVLKASAPRYPKATKLPDGTKLARAFEDALNKVVWTDDRRIVDLRWSRRFGRPRAEARLYALPDEVGELGAAPDQAALAL